MLRCPTDSDLAASDRDGGGDVGKRIVALEAEVLVAEIEDGIDVRCDVHGRQRGRRAREREIGLLQVVGIKVRIAEGVNELARLQARDLRHHHSQ